MSGPIPTGVKKQKRAKRSVGRPRKWKALTIEKAQKQEYSDWIQAVQDYECAQWRYFQQTRHEELQPNKKRRSECTYNAELRVRFDAELGFDAELRFDASVPITLN